MIPGLHRKTMSPRLEPTPRESEVMLRIMEGRADKEIARDLGMSVGTVKMHIQKLMRVYAARNRVQLAVIAARMEM